MEEFSGGEGERIFSTGDILHGKKFWELSMEGIFPWMGDFLGEFSTKEEWDFPV